MLRERLEGDFFEGRRSAALPFCVSDEVEVVRGVYSGKRGEVILLDQSHDNVRFLVDFNDGTDEVFDPSDLQLKRAGV